MKKRHLAISIIGIATILLLYFIIKDEEIVKILTLVQALFSFITLMIAIILFDRYQVGSKLNDKTLNVVLEYVEFLKKVIIIAEIHNYNQKKKGLEKNGFTIIKFESNNIINKYDQELFIDFISFMEFYSNFSKYIESPWMPKEIFEASKFLQLKDKNTIYNPEFIDNNCIILTFSLTDKSKGLMKIDDSENLEKFNENIENLMNVITKWVKKQASDINFHI